MTARITSIAILAGALVSTDAPAHHAPSIYDTKRELTLAGTVLEFDWTEPHTWTTIRTVAEDGTATVWRLEGMSPGYLGRRGWTRDSLEPGDRIEVAYFPRRDGQSIGMFIRAVLPDGSMKVMAQTDH